MGMRLRDLDLLDEAELRRDVVDDVLGPLAGEAAAAGAGDDEVSDDVWAGAA